jgi:hypothetical protein
MDARNAMGRIGIPLGAMMMALLLISGCGQKQLTGPATIPVKGKINFTKNGSLKPIVDRQGAIEFESVDQPGVKAIGDIEEDGSFTLKTMVDGGAVPGAVPGQHRVRLYLDENAQSYVAPRFLRFDKSGIAVNVASEQQEIAIDIWR